MKTESQLNSAYKLDNSPEKRSKDSEGSKVSKAKDILDLAVKLIAASSVVAVAFIANRFQSSMTATNLLSQREQADSALRAGMFHDLIDPIFGSQKSNEGTPVDRERLLVELLALNFHEHFELKPLMLHVDARLAHGEIKGMDQHQRKNARESLRSVARRVLQRQLAMLTKVENDSPPEQQACLYKLNIRETREETQQHHPQDTQPEIAKDLPLSQSCSTHSTLSTSPKYFGDLICINSPNGIYTVCLTISRPERWEDQTFQVLMQINEAVNNGSTSKLVSADHDFLLTWFDFPFTDNALLADGTRFALVIDTVYPDEKAVKLTFVWFPKDYFSARERPTNYSQLREKLGLKL